MKIRFRRGLKNESFKDYTVNGSEVSESLFGKGSSAAMAIRAKTHGDKATRSFQQGKRELLRSARISDTNEKLEILAKAVDLLLDGQIELRNQIGAVSGQIVASTL